MQRTFGRYRLVRHLASGGMGEVWLAEAAGAAGFSKRVVIKTLRPELTSDTRLVEQFVAEGQLLEQLDHPNIAQILDLGHIDETWFLAMEYVEGFDLRALMRALPLSTSAGADARDGGDASEASDAPVGVGEVVTLCVLAAALRALEHAGTRRGADGRPLGIVHHDVTPSNLMVRRDGHVKLVDFGVARSAIRAHLEPGALRGKLPYLSPEQVGDPAHVDARSDVFSLGLVAAELLSGQRALVVADAAGLEVAWAALPKRIERLCRDAPEATAALIRAMTALAPEARPADAAVASAAVRARLASLAIADIERPVAQRFAPAFARLEAAAGGFSQTLGALVAVGTDAADAATGTVSLPGLIPLGQPAASAAVAPALPLPESSDEVRPEGEPEGEEKPAPTARRPLERRRRFWFASATLLGLATLLGWWLGVHNVTPTSEGGRAAGSAADAPATALGSGAATSSRAPLQDAGVAPRDVAVPDSAVVRAAERAVGSDTTRPDAAQPDTIQPDAALPDTIQPDTIQPDSIQPDATQPDAAQPDATQPDVSSRADVPAAPRRAARRPPRPRRATSHRPAKLVGRLSFRVLPVDAEVRVDGRRTSARPVDGVYHLSLPVGRHKIEVRDAASGRVQRREEAVISGVERRVPGFTLAGDLP